jgi:hypothetical protein
LSANNLRRIPAPAAKEKAGSVMTDPQYEGLLPLF